MNIYRAALMAAVCTSTMLTAACGASTEEPVKLPPGGAVSTIVTEVTTITPTRAYSKEELKLQNPRQPEERFGNQYTHQGTVGTKCIVVVAKTDIPGEQPNYEAVVYTGSRYDMLVYRSPSVPAEIINRLGDTPAMKAFCD